MINLDLPQITPPADHDLVMVAVFWYNEETSRYKAEMVSVKPGGPSFDPAVQAEMLRELATTIDLEAVFEQPAVAVCSCGHAWPNHNVFGCFADDCECSEPRR